MLMIGYPKLPRNSGRKGSERYPRIEHVDGPDAVDLKSTNTQMKSIEWPRTRSQKAETHLFNMT